MAGLSFVECPLYQRQGALCDRLSNRQIGPDKKNRTKKDRQREKNEKKNYIEREKKKEKRKVDSKRLRVVCGNYLHAFCDSNIYTNIMYI